MELGEKLRLARAEAGLSQRELCGTVITRNMLSQIEHGVASPSIGTLRYLAGRLEKPMGYFFEEEEYLSPDRVHLRRAGEALDRGDWEGVLEELKPCGELDSPGQRLRGILEQSALLELAARAREEERLPYARELLEKSEKPRPLLPALEEKRRRLSGQEENLDGLLTIRAEQAEEALDWDRAERLLEAVEDRTTPRWKLLMGRALTAEGKFPQALACLHSAEEAFPRETAPLLEQCYRELEDFRQAYFYACRQK